MDSVQQVGVASRSSAGRAKKTRSKRTPPRTGARDYVAIADAYAKAAVDDTEGLRFGLLARLACERYLKDRIRAKNRSSTFTFDPEAAKDACSFIEKLPHVEGRWETPNIVLHDSHVFFVVNLFGFRALDGTRRFTSALLAVARKNAKSTLAAAILVYCLCCDDEPGPQVITAATTGSQARVVFNIAKKMVEKTPALREAFNLEVLAHAIVAWNASGNMRPINAKASTQDGLNPSVTALDEIHAHKTHDLLNVLQSAAGARANPLFLYTTTEGYETPGPWPEMRQFAKQLLHGLIEAEHFLVLIFSLDEQVGQKGEKGYREPDDDFDESKWVKANPLLEVNPILLKKIREAAIEAKQMPGRLAEFRIKRLNRQSSVADGWVNLIKWRACSGAVDLERLAKVPCWGGLDLSMTSDLTSYRLVWVLEDILFTYGWSWVPAVAIKERAKRGLVPYRGWVEQGHLIACGDEIIDYDMVAEKVIWSRTNFNLQKVGFDDWNSKQIEKKLTDAKVPMERVIQGPRSYHPAMKDTEERYVQQKLAHGGAPVLAWCASNLVARRDANNNLAPDKNKSLEKIDDFVAMLMANAVRLATVPKPAPKMFFV